MYWLRLAQKNHLTLRLTYRSTTIMLILHYAFQPSPNAYWDGNLPFPSKSRYPWSKPSPWHTRANVSIFTRLFVLAFVVLFYCATALYVHLVPELNSTNKIKIELSIFFRLVGAVVLSGVFVLLLILLCWISAGRVLLVRWLWWVIIAAASFRVLSLTAVVVVFVVVRKQG